MPRTRWAPEDYGRAIEAAVLSHASPKCVKRKGDRVWFNGFWRGGDDPNCVAHCRDGNWSDMKTGEHGIARDFAALAFGISVTEFMERFGPGQGPRAIRDERPRAPVARCPWDVDALWDRILGAMPDPRSDPATRWLTAVRGFPPQADAVVASGHASVSRGQVGLFPGKLRRWIARRVEITSHMIAAPIRHAGTGRVENIQFRTLVQPTDPDDNGRRFLPDAFLSDPADGTPYGYGDPYRALRADVVVLVEGMADTFAAEGFLRDHPECAAVGAISASTFGHWARYLRKKTRGQVVVACQLDKPDAKGMRVGIERAAELVDTLRAVGVPCSFFDWSRFLWAAGDARADVKDLGDAVQRFGWDSAKAAFVATLGGQLGPDGRSRGRGAEGGGAAAGEGGRARGAREADGQGPAAA
jgi:hypothetical protein